MALGQGKDDPATPGKSAVRDFASPCARSPRQRARAEAVQAARATQQAGGVGPGFGGPGTPAQELTPASASPQRASVQGKREAKELTGK